MKRALALFALLPLAACGALRSLGVASPEARLEAARLEGLSASGVTIVFDVTLVNPAAVELPVAGIEFALESGGALFLEGEAIFTRSVPARGEATLPVPATVDFAGLLRAASGARAGALVPYAVDIACAVDAPGAGRIRLPLRHEGRIPIPALPEVAVERVRWESLRLDMAAAVVEIAVTNPNAFAIDVARFAYALDLAGGTIARGGIAGSGAIEPGGRKTLPVRITFAPMDIGAAAFGLLQGKGARYALRGEMALATEFGTFTAPFDKTGDAPLGK